MNISEVDIEIAGGALARSVRRRLTADKVFNIAPTGNDVTALLTGGATPFRSPQACYDYLCLSVDFGGREVIMKMADGTYTGVSTGGNDPAFNWGVPIVLYMGRRWSGGGQLRVQGNMADWDAVQWDCNSGHGLIMDTDGGTVFFEGCEALNVGLDCSFARPTMHGARLTYNRLSGVGSGAGATFLYVSDWAFSFAYSAEFRLQGTWNTAFCANAARFNIETVTVNFVGAVHFAGGYLEAVEGGSVLYQNFTQVGTYTGARYYLVDHSHISIQDGDFAFLPETSIGGDPGYKDSTSSVNNSTDENHKKLSADAAGANVNTAQPWFPAAGAIQVQGATDYFFDGLLILSRAAGAASHTTAVLFGGTATLNSIDYWAEANVNDDATLGASNGLRVTAATAAVVKAASTSATEQIVVRVRGVLRVNAGGTLIPQFQYSAAPGGAPTVKRGSFLRLKQMDANSEGLWA